MEITATYSPEDNKIRLYASARLDEETFQRIKEAGFKWAPRQELFVAPKWTPGREDIAIALAGEIEPEEMTLAERAEAKSDRLADIASKRETQASAYHRAADELSRAFENGQPILVGHHSERKARKTQEKMHANMSNAVKASRAVDYWLYRAESVQRHANYKNDPRTRARRIKTLLAELRDLQRRINKAHKTLEMWRNAETPEQIKILAGHFEMSLSNHWYDLENGKITHDEVKSQSIAAFERTKNSPGLRRWIMHTLNRLAYEQELLGAVMRYNGAITPTVIQMFVREHGADKPKGAKIDDDLFSVTCEAPLPVHIAEGCTAELSGDEWRDLMQNCGYHPPEKKPAKPPILNFKASNGTIQVTSRATYRGASEVEDLPQAEMTKAEYAAIYTDYKGTRLSSCGEFRVRITLNPNHMGPRYQAGWAAIFITDQKPHDTPLTAHQSAAQEATAS
jgi:hypothetical protein